MGAYWLADVLDEVWSSPMLAWSEHAACYVPPLENMIDKVNDWQALIPSHAILMEPHAMHPESHRRKGDL